MTRLCKFIGERRALQWTADESLCAKLVTNTVQFFKPSAFESGPAHHLHLEHISEFAISPGRTPHVAAFVPEKKGAPASIRLYTIPNFARATAQKTFYKADKIALHWHPMGTNLLCVASTDVDKTNQSYYGESNLYFLSATGGGDAKVQLGTFVLTC